MNQLLLLRFLSEMTSVAVDDSHESFRVRLDKFKTYFLDNYGEKHRSGMLLMNEVWCDTDMIPAIPDTITREFIVRITRKIRERDEYYVVNIEGKATKYLNDYLLGGITGKVLDFLVDYGFQERWFMELSPNIRFVMGCIIKFYAAKPELCIIIKKYRKGVNINYDPQYITVTDHVSHYNTAFYLDMIKENKSIGIIPVISKDVEFDKLIDSVMKIASDVGVENFDTKCENIIKITGSINVECLTDLITRIQLEYLKRNCSYRGRNYLLNYCMVFVLSKLLGIDRAEAFAGKNEKQIAFSYLMRHKLENRDQRFSNYWISQ